MNPYDGDPTGAPGLERDDRLTALTDRELETSPDFMIRVRRRICRRDAVSHVTSYSWHLTRMILIEMAGMIRHILTVFGGGKGS